MSLAWLRTVSGAGGRVSSRCEKRVTYDLACIEQTLSFLTVNRHSDALSNPGHAEDSCCKDKPPYPYGSQDAVEEPLPQCLAFRSLNTCLCLAPSEQRQNDVRRSSALCTAAAAASHECPTRSRYASYRHCCFRYMRDLVLWGWWLLACTHHIGLAVAQSQPDAVRGVNLGGWLLIEQWWVWLRRWKGDRAGAHMQDHPVAVPPIERRG